MPRLGLEGGVAVVTGAASGIGRATALALARHGFDVAEADRVAALSEEVLAAHGRVTALVNNAGVALVGRRRSRWRRSGG